MPCTVVFLRRFARGTTIASKLRPRGCAMKRLGLCAAIVLVLAVGLAFVLPASRYRILAYLHDEPLYDGRPLDYWVAALKDPEPPARREAALTLSEPEVRRQCEQ